MTTPVPAQRNNGCTHFLLDEVSSAVFKAMMLWEIKHKNDPSQSRSVQDMDSMMPRLVEEGFLMQEADGRYKLAPEWA